MYDFSIQDPLTIAIVLLLVIFVIWIIFHSILSLPLHIAAVFWFIFILLLYIWIARSISPIWSYGDYFVVILILIIALISFNLSWLDQVILSFYE